jgi:hypothetical protein
MCMEVVVANFKWPPQYFRGETEKTHKSLRTVNVPSKLLPSGPDVGCGKDWHQAKTAWKVALRVAKLWTEHLKTDIDVFPSNDK